MYIHISWYVYSLGSELMPSRRARDFVRMGIKSPMDLAVANVDAITAILLSEIPYESGKPLAASFVSKDPKGAKGLVKDSVHTGAQTGTGGTGGNKGAASKGDRGDRGQREISDEDEMRLTRYSCERLAHKLKKAASNSIIEENSLAALLAEHV